MLTVFVELVDALQIVDAACFNADVFLKLGVPSAGTHVLTVQPGSILRCLL
jgi:hypothetical protein